MVDFAQARAFEINAMHTAMRQSKDSAAQRAFQSLPRNLRRRAASHNIKRLPVRLRERAMREVKTNIKEGCMFTRSDRILRYNLLNLLLDIFLRV